MSRKYVSRAGGKLDYALEQFGKIVKGLMCADFGSSTGGFVDVLIKRGAAKVFAVDTAYGELAWSLRNNPRVVVLERTNALHVELPEKMDFISVDMGWTSVRLVVPAVLKNLKSGGEAVLLLKPHYELGKSKPTDKEANEIKNLIIKDLQTIPGLLVKNVLVSPIVGKRGGNKEFLLFIAKA